MLKIKIGRGISSAFRKVKDVRFSHFKCPQEICFRSCEISVCVKTDNESVIFPPFFDFISTSLTYMWGFFFIKMLPNVTETTTWDRLFNAFIKTHIFLYEFFSLFFSVRNRTPLYVVYCYYLPYIASLR